MGNSVVEVYNQNQPYDEPSWLSTELCFSQEVAAFDGVAVFGGPQEIREEMGLGVEFLSGARILFQCE